MKTCIGEGDATITSTSNSGLGALTRRCGVGFRRAMIEIKITPTIRIDSVTLPLLLSRGILRQTF
jgi:hypothetical protein